MFVGYYKDDEKTAETKTPDGFVHSGDAGFFDAKRPSQDHRPRQRRGQDARRRAVPAEIRREQAEILSQHQGSGGFGDGRDHVAAFINIDLVAVSNWAERNGVTYASYQELAGHPLVYDMIEKHVDEVNRSLASEPRMGGAQIKRFLILHKELDADDGELTRTQKVRRGFIAERYAPLIQALYDGSTEADISTEVTFEDGRKGVISARVKITDMKFYPAAASDMFWRPRNESARPPVARQGRRAARGRERVAALRRREGAHRRVLRHPQERDPRHHRPQRRRQDLDAQLHQRLLLPAPKAASPSRA